MRRPSRFRGRDSSYKQEVVRPLLPPMHRPDDLDPFSLSLFLSLGQQVQVDIVSAVMMTYTGNKEYLSMLLQLLLSVRLDLCAFFNRFLSICREDFKIDE